jgi:hypothetical protein
MAMFLKPGDSCIRHGILDRDPEFWIAGSPFPDEVFKKEREIPITGKNAGFAVISTPEKTNHRSKKDYLKIPVSIHSPLEFRHASFGTLISKRAPLPGSPVSVMVMFVMERISRAR